MATTMGYDITNREDIFMPENDIVDVRKQRMTDEDKRLITEWLGELWVIYTTCQRPFTPDDWPSLGAIKEKIVEEGKWYNFFNWSRDFYQKAIQHDIGYADYTNWLMDPIRFPELVVGWWRERGRG